MIRINCYYKKLTSEYLCVLVGSMMGSYWGVISLKYLDYNNINFLRCNAHS
jgi:hypothetical protein